MAGNVAKRVGGGGIAAERKVRQERVAPEHDMPGKRSAIFVCDGEAVAGRACPVDAVDVVVKADI